MTSITFWLKKESPKSVYPVKSYESQIKKIKSNTNEGYFCQNSLNFSVSYYLIFCRKSFHNYCIINVGAIKTSIWLIQSTFTTSAFLPSKPCSLKSGTKTWATSKFFKWLPCLLLGNSVKNFREQFKGKP